MRSGILILMLLGLFICLAEVSGDCECTQKTAKTNTGKTLGRCLEKDNSERAPKEHKGREYCYVEKGNGSCCQRSSIRFVNHCINYDACKTFDPRFG